jgi:hypothetical protein
VLLIVPLLFLLALLNPLCERLMVELLLVRGREEERLEFGASLSEERRFVVNRGMRSGEGNNDESKVALY